MSFLFTQGIRTRVYSCVSKSLASVFATRRYAEDIRHPGFETGVWAFVGRQQSRGAYAKRVSSRGYHRPRYLHIACGRAETHYMYSPYHVRGRYRSNGMGCDVRVKANLIPSRLRFSHPTVSASCAAFRQRSSSSRRMILPWMPSSRRRRTI